MNQERRYGIQERSEGNSQDGDPTMITTERERESNKQPVQIGTD